MPQLLLQPNGRSVRTSFQPSRAMTLPWHRGWIVALTLPTAAYLLYPKDAPEWGLMWALAITMYAGAKWLTWRRTSMQGVPAWKQFAYLVLWPGMNAAGFTRRATHQPVRPTVNEWLLAVAKTFFGVTLLFVGTRALTLPYLAAWLGMIGVVMFLHFGVFHFLSCAWRSAGFDAPPLMNLPIAARGVNDFWSRRWNTAFRDLTHRFVFRPCADWLGIRWALAIGFVFSGLVHEVAISVPAGAGYGRPTAYFLIQAMGLFAEHSVWGRRFGLGQGIRGRVFGLFVVLAPLGLLFHHDFVTQVMTPWIEFVGGLR